MEIVIIFFLSVTLLNFTMLGAMHNQIANIPGRENVHASSTPEYNRVVIQKLIGGYEAIDDAVEGTLYPFTTDHPNLDHDTFGHAILSFYSGEKFFACLRPISGYDDLGNDKRDNSKNTTFRCSIKKGNDVSFKLSLSRHTGETRLHGVVARIDFFNHHGVLFVGELQPATPYALLPLNKKRKIDASGPGHSSSDPLLID